MTQYVFGTGQLFSLPIAGGAPMKFGALQDVSVDFSGDIKQLHGQYQYALSVARGKSKVEWKASTGNIDATAFNTIYFNESAGVETGQLVQAINEVNAIPATPGPYTLTVDHAADFSMDLGVKDATTGEPYLQVATAPAAGQYSVTDAGVYTFAAADEGKDVLIDYLWEDSANGGSLTITNQLMGSAPRFMLVLSQVFEGKVFTLVLYANVADKLSLPLKQDDYLISEISGQSFANDAGNVARITTTSITGGGG